MSKNSPVKIKRALISVSDKKNILVLAKSLQKESVEIISTGGTLKFLVEAGIDDFYIDNDPISSISNIDSYDIRVFPNPTEDGYVYISGLSSSFRYSLFNLSGQLISHGANNSIFLKNKGVYILKIQNDEGNFIKKIIF